MTFIPSRRDVLKTGSALALGATLGTPRAGARDHARGRRSSTSSPRRKARSPGTPPIPTTRPRRRSAATSSRPSRASRRMWCAPPRRSPISASRRSCAPARCRSTCSPRPTSATTCTLKDKKPARAIRSGQRQQADRGLQELRSGRLLHGHLGRPDRDRLQHREAEGGRRAEELARPRSIRNGRTRSRSAIRASPAMSAPGW